MTLFFLTAGVLFELVNPYRTSCEKNTRRFQSVSRKKLNQGEGGGRGSRAERYSGNFSGGVEIYGVGGKGVD